MRRHVASLLLLHGVAGLSLRHAAAPRTAPRAAAPSMCGILAVVNSKLSPEALRLQTLTLQRLVRHRGPDGSGIHVVETPTGARCSSVAHERLAIVDPLSGNQPLFSHDRSRSLTVNGEIYNHKQLRAELKDPTAFRTESDCEVIVHGYDEFGVDIASKLDGDFAFVILDDRTGDVYAARDPVGVNSLYMGTGLDGSTWFSSEAKPLVTGGCIDVRIFPPGHYYLARGGEEEGRLVPYYAPSWHSASAATQPLNLEKLRTTFTAAVEKRLMADVPYGVLLSGGLDSSLVASVIARLKRKRFLEHGKVRRAYKSFSTSPAHLPQISRKSPAHLPHISSTSPAHLPHISRKSPAYLPHISRTQVDDLQPVKSFSIGLDGSPDLANAQKVAEFIGTEHYGFTFTVQEGIDAISDVIYHLETYDVTTIRAGTPMFLLARKIKAMGIKMVMSGEGADETLAVRARVCFFFLRRMLFFS